MEDNIAGLSLRDDDDEAWPMALRVLMSGLGLSFVSLVVSLRPVGESSSSALCFVDFWVQVHHVSLGYYYEDLARQFGNFLGIFFAFDSTNFNFGSHHSLWVRVKLDVRIPLKRKKCLALAADHYESDQLERLWFGESMKRSSFATYAAVHFPISRVFDAPHFVSGHCPLIIIDVASLSEVVSRQLDTMFRFESRWVFKSSCEYEIMRADPFDDILAEITAVKLTLNMEADREDLFWGQRAWVNWLCYGDRSTSFYHKFATFRKHLNSVSSLVDDDGRTCPDIDAMFGVATRYFQGFFTSSRSENFDNFLEGIKVCITHLMNGVLLSNFTFQDIRSAIDGMSHLKALGRDRFSALFF
ncbi:hypothetical protein Golob_023164 [Gossypium lobatum]|uniref:Uncharacterized protein n=1 Tax=Gossypium lobatum TaxID=34289 RepID=A0A7J8LIW5_9ROSI|nr:hypothetical protein [Gossypium lobatum]